MTDAELKHARRERPRHAKRMRTRASRKTILAVAATSIVAVAGASLSGLAAQAATPAAAGNFVVNGTFAAGTTGWEGGRNTKLATSAGRNDAQGVRLTNTSTAAATITLNDRVNSVKQVTAGHTYQVNAWVRVEKATQNVAIKLLEEDAKYAVIGSNQTVQKRADTTWKLISTTYTAVRATTSLDINILAPSMTPQNALLVDDVTLTDITPAASAKPTPPVTTTPTPKPTSTITPAPSPKPSATPTPTTPPTTPKPTPTPTPPTTPTAPAGWKLAWSDEFNGTAVDRSIWNVDNKSTYGDGNSELACLMDRPENVKVADGVLTIAALKEATPIACGTNDSRFPNGRSYTSGMLTTKNKVDFEYGRFEISAKTPLAQGTSKGLWPAFWMRPSVGGIGELDILEAIGTAKTDPFSANHVVQTIHYDYVGTHPKQGTGYDMPTGTTADGFHNYAVEWEPGSITWFVDGVKTYQRTLSTTSWIDQAFVKDFYLRLNMAVGGSWPGSPDADTAFPARYQVDYVRVYQR